jgi:hypothetical protein
MSVTNDRQRRQQRRTLNRSTRYLQREGNVRNAEREAERAKTKRLKALRLAEPADKDEPTTKRTKWMEYAVKAETQEGDVVTLQRGFPSRSDAEDYPSDCLDGGASGLSE